MSHSIRIALAQLNTIVGDLSGNSSKIRDSIEKARQAQADIVMLPELTVAGYPPEDLLLKSQFVRDNKACIKQLLAASKGITVIVGFVDAYFNTLYNAAAVLHDGNWIHTYHKTHLPNYGVFDEKRYFQSGNKIPIFEFDGLKIGLNICEDIWIPNSITECQAFCADAQVILNMSASPYSADKTDLREDVMRTRAIHTRSYVCCVNLIGGQDELVFDGHSLIIAPDGKVLARGKQFEEDFVVRDLDVSGLRYAREHDQQFSSNKSMFHLTPEIEHIELSGTVKEKTVPLSPAPNIKPLDDVPEIYHALKLGVHDYVHKNGFKAVVLGLSGGIDSALTAAIACDALGSANVIGISMPSHYSSEGSIKDAKDLAAHLKMPFHIIPIKSVYDAYSAMFADVFGGLKEDITEENIQARIRGNIVMAFSNKFGYLPLTTGNKSEVSVGYATLYGDMAGGFSIIKDVPKMLVYELSRYVNREKEIIPESTITKPPSAELRPDQKDEDSLPPYDILDPILEMYVERDYEIQRIIDAGYDGDTVTRVVQLVDFSEYKRRQAAPGVKITPRAFGKDRRMPITNHYRHEL